LCSFHDYVALTFFEYEKHGFLWNIFGTNRPFPAITFTEVEMKISAFFNMKNNSENE